MTTPTWNLALVVALSVGAFGVPACASGGDDTDQSGADVTAGGASAALGSPLASGNGFGFAVYAPKDGVVNAFYAHPTRFLTGDKANPKGDGIEAPNLINKLHWKASGTSKSAAYVSESQVVKTDGQAAQTFFMPFGVSRSVMITSFLGSASGACLDVAWGDDAQKLKATTVSGRSVGTVAFKGETDTVAIFPLVPLDQGAAPKFDGCISGGTTWAVVGLEAAGDLQAAVDEVVAWQAGATGNDLVQREVADLDKWRVEAPAGLSDPESKLWRQSETILRMAQIRQPNTDARHAHGLILASLPAGEWFIPWVRDMAYATVALTRMGHQQEAKDALMAYLEAQPVGIVGDLTRNIPYQISTVRYFGDGSEEADFADKGGRNVELDSWGLALWALSEYFSKYQDKDFLAASTYRGSVYENARDYIVKPLLGNLDQVDGGEIVAIDTSCWEENSSDRKHYAFSTISAINGLRSFVPLAEASGDSATVTDLNRHVTSLQGGFEKSFITSPGPGGRIKGTVEPSPKDDMNGAVIEAFNWGVVTDPSVIDGTVAKMSALARPSGGFRRVTGTTSYEKHEFLFIDFAMARLFLRLGQKDKAADLLNRTVQRSGADHNFVPEMYVSEKDSEFPGKVGDPTGAIPMVGYGAGIYAITMMERAGGTPPAADAPAPAPSGDPPAQPTAPVPGDDDDTNP